MPTAQVPHMLPTVSLPAPHLCGCGVAPLLHMQPAQQPQVLHLALGQGGAGCTRRYPGQTALLPQVGLQVGWVQRQKF
jgi:hypothetical protein